jgi:uncharacterized membrane protein
MEIEPREGRYLLSVGLLSFVCLALLAVRVLATGTTRYGFVIENLGLAWVSLLFCWLLVKNLARENWLNWKNIILTILFLVFLPNTWYVLTDFIHLKSTTEISLLYDIALLNFFVLSGFILGCTCLYMFHLELLKRLKSWTSWLIILGLILASSFAIYIGRDLRWSSWDIVSDPGGFLASVSDRILDPFGHPRTLNVTGIFFIAITTTYTATWLFLDPESRHSRGKR